MNKLVLYPLITLMLIGAFCQIFYSDSTSAQVDYTYNETIAGQLAQGNQTISGKEDEYTGQAQDAVFDINMTTGIIALIIGLVAVGVIAGIRILGSGLSEHSVKLIYNSTIYYGLWGVFSSLAFPLFLAIDFMQLGLFFWFGMTLVYSLGFFQTLDGSGGE